MVVLENTALENNVCISEEQRDSSVLWPRSVLGLLALS